MTTRSSSPHKALSATLAALVLLAAHAGAALPDPSSLVSSDTLFFVDVASVDGLQAQARKTAIWDLYRDPAMRPFIVPAEKNVREEFEKAFTRDLWRSLEFANPPKELPIPTGRLAIVSNVSMRTFEVPVYGWDDDGPDDERKVIRTRKVTEPDVGFLFMAEMGRNMAGLTRILKRIEEVAVRNGIKRERKTVRGIEMTVLTRLARGEDDTPPAGREEPQAFCYFLKDDVAMISNAPALLAGALARMGGASASSLSEDAGFRAAMQPLGKGAVRAYMSAKPLLAFAKAEAGPDGAVGMDALLRTLGLTNVAGVGTVVQIAPEPNVQARIRACLAVRGEKTGLVASLSPENGPLANNPLLADGLTSFVVANYDWAKVIEQIRQIVISTGGEDFMTGGKARMRAIARDDPAGRPPVNLEKEFFGQLTKPMILAHQIKTPYTAPDASQIMIAIATRNRGVLDTALGRIYAAIGTASGKETSRSLLGTNIYLHPVEDDFDRAIFGGRSAMALPSNALIVGGIANIEQAIRNARRTDLRPIQSDPMFRYARRYLPDQAGVFLYNNNQAIVGMVWPMLRDAAAKSRGGGLPERPQNVMAMFAVETVREFRKACDFTRLPEFAAIRKYFGATVGYIKSTDSGIFLELTYLGGPPTEPEPRTPSRPETRTNRNSK